MLLNTVAVGLLLVRSNQQRPAVPRAVAVAFHVPAEGHDKSRGVRCWNFN
jgi:hypothetical protein